MKHPTPAFSRLYQASLREYFAQGSGLDSEVISKIGSKAWAAKLPTREIAKLHEQFVVADLLPDCPARKRSPLIRKAGNFFAAVIAASGAGKKGGGEDARLRKSIESMSGRNVELAVANQQLDLDIIQQGKVETKLRESEQRVTKALEKSEGLKEQLRQLSRSCLSVQEEERKKISRELHDVIAQSLVGINVRLATLKTEAGQNLKRLAKNITLTQKMVTKSTGIVHKFALELRPAVLDDLGLIPALESSMKTFTTRTGIRAHLTAFEGVEKISAVKRTVLYRVAQEALINVERHAHASRVDVVISQDTKCARMEVSDDGQSFEAQAVLMARKSKRLGLLGMRERAEMVGGTFEIESAPDEGTKIIALIPAGKAVEKQWHNESPKKASQKASQKS